MHFLSNDKEKEPVRLWKRWKDASSFCSCCREDEFSYPHNEVQGSHTLTRWRKLYHKIKPFLTNPNLRSFLTNPKLTMNFPRESYSEGDSYLALLFQYGINLRSRVIGFCLRLIKKTNAIQSHLARIFYKMNIRINHIFNFSEVLQKMVFIVFL